jgi:hypothetical protein
VSGQHVLFYAVGLILGAGAGIVSAQSFSEDHPRGKVLAYVIPLALAGGLVLGWALNAWFDYIQYTRNGGSAPM